MITTAYFLDFDHTLFDTDGFFHVDVRNVMLQFAIDQRVWEESYAAVFPTGYTFEKHIEEMDRRAGKPLPRKAMQRVITESFTDLTRYLFPDVVPFLARVKKAGATLHLLSFGNETWQRYKVVGSGIDHFFSALIFTDREGKKADRILHAAEYFPRLVAIDNNPAELDMIRDVVPHARTVCINRVPDELLVPADEKSRVRFLDARRYTRVAWRHAHIACRTLEEMI